jgi:signal transduction histidine kinase
MSVEKLPRALLYSGLAAWLGVVLATIVAAIVTGFTSPRFGPWGIVSLLFVAAFVWNARSPRTTPYVLATQSACVVAMVALLCNGYEGMLLVLVAVQLALHTEQRIGLAWIVVQSTALCIAIAFHWSIQSALVLAPPYLGFQLLMFAAVRLFASERRVRNELGAAHQAVLALQSELADKSRVEERLRIAQDLHDSLGHHLIALGLHLELAAHKSDGNARGAVRSAQVIARTVLQEVKAIVNSWRNDRPVDFPREMRQLADELPHPKLHINCASDLAFADARTGRALLRTVQEIVTNAIRHGAAHNVWIDIERGERSVRLAARDDGHSAGVVTEGVGLAGMRRRMEELGGTLSAGHSVSGGFEVHAELPATDSVLT